MLLHAFKLPKSLQKDVDVIVGRCEGGSFAALKHRPSGVYVSSGPLGNRKLNTVLAQISRELIDKVNAANSSLKAKPKVQKRRCPLKVRVYGRSGKKAIAEGNREIADRGQRSP